MGVLLKSYRQHTRRVRNPLSGRWDAEPQLIPSGADEISFQNKTYYADTEGWFNVPAEVADFLTRGAYPGGERFLTRWEAQERVRLGNVADAIEEEPKPIKRAAKKAA